MWRTVSFVERVEVEFSGVIFNQAIVLGDLDNDKGNELAVGNIDGTLAVFKGRGHKPWKRCSNLGMISCVGIGDLCNTGKNKLYCLTAEGWFYVFDVHMDEPEGHESHEEGGDNLKPLFKQHLPPNGKVMQTADADGDGQLELAIGYSDRAVRLYKWVRQQGPLEGDFLQIDMWQLAGQICSISLNKTAEGHCELLASQPGGTYVTLVHNPKCPDNVQEGEGSVDRPTNLIYNPLVASWARNCNISSEIIGNIRKGPQSSTSSSSSSETDVLHALCTLDGTLVLVEKNQILWSLQVDHQLFSLSKLDVTGNGKDEVVCCSWDGQTYIVNHGREAVRYQFEENVAGFAAGFYAVNTTENSPCFVYATFNNKIYIYYNISLPQVESTNLVEVMDKYDETNKLLEKLHIRDATNDQLRELYHWVLYGWKHKS